MEKPTKIKVQDYGDMLAKVFDMTLVAYQTYGSYQGEYLAVLEDNGVYKFYIDSYGSCSGCDWLEAEQDWNTVSLGVPMRIERMPFMRLTRIFPRPLWPCWLVTVLVFTLVFVLSYKYLKAI